MYELLLIAVGVFIGLMVFVKSFRDKVVGAFTDLKKDNNPPAE